MKRTALLTVSTVIVLLLGSVAPLQAGDGQKKKWIDEVAVNLLPSGAMDEETCERLMRDYDPDILDWARGALANAGNWFTMRGVRVCGGAWECEWQEVKRLQPLIDRFDKNGLACGITGKHYYGKKYDVYLTCHNGPKWHEFQKQGLLSVVPLVDCVSQDNLVWPTCYCEWCRRGFLKYMRSKYSPDELKKLGVNDSWSFGGYITAKGLRRGSEDMVADPVIREYTRFIYRSNLDALADTVGQIKQIGKMLGKQIYFWGNQSNHFGRIPYCVMESDIVDVIWLEVRETQPQYVGPRKAWSAFNYKASLGAGRHRKPVWVISYRRKPNAILNALAEAQANGGVITDIWHSTVGENYEASSAFAKFVNANRSLFLHRRAVAQVALVWSMPSEFIRHFGRKPEWMGRYGLGAIASVLENAHIPYEMIVFGCPGFWEDGDTLKSLNRYDALILCDADCLTDEQITALKSFVQDGGGLLIFGECGTRNENFEKRSEPAFPQLKEGLNRSGRGRIILKPKSLLKDYLAGGMKPVAGDPSFNSLVEAVRSAIAEPLLIETDAPETVWLNIWKYEYGKKLAVHLVNYAIDPETDEVKPTPPITLRLRIPEGFDFGRVRFFSFGDAPRALDFERKDGRIVLQVPSFNHYAIAVLTTGEELEAANAIADCRKLLDRIRVASGGEPDDAFSSQLVDAEKCYRDDDFSSARSKAAALKAELKSRLSEIIERNLQREEAKRGNAIQLAKGAVRAFDFGGGSTADGFTQVAASTRYSPERGFGWEDTTALQDVDRNAPDDLHRDFVQGKTDATFICDLPNGRYDITYITGDTLLPWYRYEPRTWCDGLTNIYANGKLMLMGVPRRPDMFESYTFPVEVSDGRLRLTFQRKSRGAWQVNALVIRKATEREPEPLREGAIRDWLVIGPFDNTDCLGLVKSFPPERELDVTKTYDGKGGRVRWYRYEPKSREGFCRVGFDGLFEPSEEAVAYAVTHIKSPRATRARLAFGSTGRAVVWLNGKELIRDVKTDGLRPDEYIAQAPLKAGWNRLLVKVCHNWGKEWAFAAALLTDEKDISVSATGDLPIAKLPPRWEMNPPRIQADSSTIELGGAARLTLTFKNDSPARAISGTFRLASSKEQEKPVKIEPVGDTKFADLKPGAVASARFKVTLQRLVPPPERKGLRYLHGPEAGLQPPRLIKLLGTVETEGRALASEAQLNVLQPELRIYPTDLSCRIIERVIEMRAGGLTFAIRERGGIQYGNQTIRASIANRDYRKTHRDQWLKTFQRLDAETVVDTPSRKVLRCTFDVRGIETGTIYPDYRMELECEVRAGLPCLFVTARLRNLGEPYSAYQYWSGGRLTGYTIAGMKNMPLEPKGWNIMVSNGWVFVHTKEEPLEGFGWIVRGKAGYGEPRAPYIISDPSHKKIARGEAHEVRFVLVPARSPQTVACVNELIRLTEESFSGGSGRMWVGVCLLNPMSRATEGELLVDIPRGWRSEPEPVQRVSLEPRGWAMKVFNLVPPADARAGRYPVGVRFSIPQAGELTANSTIQFEATRKLRIPKTGTAPTIDGNDDDPCWKNAAVAAGFVLNDGSAPARHATTVRATYDNSALYLLFECEENDMNSIVSRCKDRDGVVWQDDSVEVFIDVGRTRKSYAHLVVNSLGVLMDEKGRNRNWDSGAKVAARLLRDSWRVEMAIPFSGLGRAPRKGETWGINFCRSRPRGASAEYSCWSCTFGTFHNPSRFGVATFHE